MQENNSALSGTKLPGQVNAMGLQHGRKSCSGGAELCSCPTSLLPWLPVPPNRLHSFPSHRLAPLFPDWRRLGRQRVPSARHSMPLAWFHFYLLLFFTTIYLFIPIFISLWTCPACHLGFAENVNKKAAFKCNLSLHEYIPNPTQLQCSHPEIKT